MNYRNAKYINANGLIDCEIEHSTYGWIPYTLDPSDTDMTVNNDDLLAAMSANKDVAAYVAPTQSELNAISANEVRGKRDAILSSKVDKIVSNPLRWASMSAETQAAWATYRQALLDIPQQADFPRTVSWPVAPSA